MVFNLIQKLVGPILSKIFSNSLLFQRTDTLSQRGIQNNIGIVVGQN